MERESFRYELGDVSPHGAAKKISTKYTDGLAIMENSISAFVKKNLSVGENRFQIYQKMNGWEIEILYSNEEINRINLQDAFRKKYPKGFISVYGASDKFFIPYPDSSTILRHSSITFQNIIITLFFSIFFFIISIFFIKHF